MNYKACILLCNMFVVNLVFAQPVENTRTNSLQISSEHIKQGKMQTIYNGNYITSIYEAEIYKYDL